MREIPVSAAVLPFLSNTERLFGLALMKQMFRALYWESRATGKPIVFVMHVEDLNADGGTEKVGRLAWRHVIPSRTHGLRLRFLLFERDWRNVHRDMVALLRYMSGFNGVRFMTVRDYLPVLQKNVQPPAAAKGI